MGLFNSFLFFNWFLYYYFRIFRPSFLFQNKKYDYFCHKYNFTWVNERAIEIPLVWPVLKEYKGKRILEVGNVLSHYFDIKHDVIDKYEKAKKVINQDIVDFKPKQKYDLILSISTLEHIGFDETPKEPKKTLKVLKNLKLNCLNPGGKLVITFPFGQNPNLDDLLAKKELGFTKEFYFKRVSLNNKWRETDWNGIKGRDYCFAYSYANALVMGIIE